MKSSRASQASTLLALSTSATHERDNLFGVSSNSGAAGATIDVTGVSRRFGSVWALRDVSFSIRPNEILGVIGPNGSGKTTLFRCLAGLTPADAGAVTVAGQPIAAEHRRSHLAFIPDGIRPWPDQSVDWVLRFIAALHGVSGDVAREIMARLALEPLRRERLGRLSKGEHRRVLTAIGLLAPVPLLVLDEPFDGLDLRQAREMMSILRAHVATGRTLLLSIHQLTDAERICDRLVLLNGGRVVGEGTLDELRRRTDVGPDAGLEEIFLALT